MKKEEIEIEEKIIKLKKDLIKWSELKEKYNICDIFADDLLDIINRDQRRLNNLMEELKSLPAEIEVSKHMRHEAIIKKHEYASQMSNLGNEQWFLDEIAKLKQGLKKMKGD